MVHIIGSGSEHTPRVFAQFGLDKNRFEWITIEFRKIISASFSEDARQRRGQTGRIVDDGSQNITTNEINRRFDILQKWFTIMHGDLKWTVRKAVDHLADALRFELDGKDYEPPGIDRAMWSPATGVSR